MDKLFLGLDITWDEPLKCSMEIQVSGTDMIPSIQYVHLSPFASSQGRGQAELHFRDFLFAFVKFLVGKLSK